MNEASSVPAVTLGRPLVVTSRPGSRAAPAGRPAGGRRKIKCVIDGQQPGGVIEGVSG